VATAGDVNGDGYADVIVGAYSNDAGGTDAGRAYVYFGGPGADAVADLTLTGTAAGDYFGYSVATAGDVNGDGYADVIVGACTNDAGGTDAGRAYVYAVYPYQVLSPDGGEQWVAGQPVTVRWLGHDVADIALSTNGGQGYATVAMGVGGAEDNRYTLTAPSTTTHYAKIRVTYSGQTSKRSTSDASDGVFRIVAPGVPPDAVASFGPSPRGAAAGDYFGQSVAGLGDFDGDGFPDIVAGARGNDSGGADAGQAYIHRGGPAMDVAADLVLTGEAAGDLFGRAVARAGDINSDGFTDLIVGAEGNDGGGSGSGRAYVFFGGPGADNSPDLVITGTAGENAGSALAGAGDFNGDGFDDLLVGAPYNDTGGTDAGRALLCFGGPGADGVADVIVTGQAAGDRLGSALAGVGDVNGDGFDDVIVGAYLVDASPAAADVGRAYVCFGGTTPDGVPDLVLTGFALGDNLGVSVGGAGDMNGDGYDDFVVGAWGGGLGAQQGPGEAYVYFGGPSLAAVPDLILGGAARYDLFGCSVGSAGDVNDDGYADLVVGAYNNDAAGSNAGSASVFFGGPAPDAVADLVFTGEAAGDAFGWSVSGGGDLDGAGFDDLVVGVPLNDGAGDNAGAASVIAFHRYLVATPAAGETWNVGATRTVRWQGAEPADLWLSVDGGASYALLAGGLGGAADNSHALRVPHTPTRFARVKLTPHDAAVSGAGVSDSLFTIQTSVELLALSVTPAPEGGALLTWNTEPGVGPDGLAGWRLYRCAAGERGDGTRIGPALITEPRYTDAAATPGCSWRLTAVNGLEEELELGTVAMAERITGLKAWPSPLTRGATLTVAFAAPVGAAGTPVSDLDVGVFDVHGRRVATLAHGQLALPAGGAHRLSWTGGAAPGIYFVRVSAPSAGLRLERKVVVMP
jgi:hypothetical protein